MSRRTAISLVGVGVLLGLVPEAPAVAAPATEPSVKADEPEPEATWKFRHDDKPIKVMILGGSTGAFGRQPYASELGRLCKNVEVKNLSKTGLGAFPQKLHFKHQVLRNRWLSPRNPEHEFWLVHAGTVNSVATPKATNHHIKNTIILAHNAKMKVLALTLTPWGDDGDKRFRGASGLRYREWSDATADYVMGRVSPKEALGAYAEKRKAGADAPWDPVEIPDLAVDLYDSALRHRSAVPRDWATVRKSLEEDARWAKAHRKMDPGVREALLIADTAYLGVLPLWYLRDELRSFDHIHPNQAGHALIAATMCPKMPENWGCECEPTGDETVNGSPEANTP